MKPLWLFALALAALAAPAPPAEPEGSLDEAVSALTAAMTANDADRIGGWLSDDWTIIDGNGGIVGRARFLEAVRSGELTHDTMAFGEVEVRRIGDATLWIVRARGSGGYRGHPFAFDERSTSVWARRNGRWTCLFTQLTSITHAA